MKDKEQATDAEVIKFYKEKSLVLKARLEYQKLDTEIAVELARKYEAINKLATFQNNEEDGNKSASN